MRNPRGYANVFTCMLREGTNVIRYACECARPEPLSPVSLLWLWVKVLFYQAGRRVNNSKQTPVSWENRFLPPSQESNPLCGIKERAVILTAAPGDGSLMLIRSPWVLQPIQSFSKRFLQAFGEHVFTSWLFLTPCWIWSFLTHSYCFSWRGLCRWWVYSFGIVFVSQQQVSDGLQRWFTSCRVSSGREIGELIRRVSFGQIHASVRTTT